MPSNQGLKITNSQTTGRHSKEIILHPGVEFLPTKTKVLGLISDSSVDFTKVLTQMFLLLFLQSLPWNLGFSSLVSFLSQSLSFSVSGFLAQLTSVEVTQR